GREQEGTDEPERHRRPAGHPGRLVVVGVRRLRLGTGVGEDGAPGVGRPLPAVPPAPGRDAPGVGVPAGRGGRVGGRRAHVLPSAAPGLTSRTNWARSARSPASSPSPVWWRTVRSPAGPA